VSDVYTRYVRGLPDDGSEPDSGRFDELWEQLRVDVRREMARRSLHDLPPSRLGLHAAGWGDAGAMDELLQEVYLYAFLERLSNLRRKLRVCDNIDGIVILHIRHLLTDLQRRHDLIGYRVYELVLRAVRESLAAGDLYVVGRDTLGSKPRHGVDKVRNDTVLGFHPRPSAARTAPEFKDQVTAWNDDLLPDLVTARKRGTDAVVRKLRDCLLRLKAAGWGPFTFKDLVDTLKSDVRRRWLALWSRDVEAEAHQHLPADLPSLHRCVMGKIDQESREKVRDDLAKMWKFLLSTSHERDGHLPSNVKLAAALGVDRSRVPQLLASLKRLVDECHTQQQTPPPEAPSEGERR